MANYTRKDAENAGKGIIGGLAALVTGLVGMFAQNKQINNQINQKSNEYLGLGKYINRNEINELEKKKWW